MLEDNSENLKTIRGFWVDEHFRGRGIGTFLLNYVLREFEHEPVDIKVNITPGAEKIYTDRGFKIIGHRDDFDMNIGLWKALSSSE